MDTFTKTILFFLFQIILFTSIFAQENRVSVGNNSFVRDKIVTNRKGEKENEVFNSQTSNNQRKRGGFVVSAYIGGTKTASTNLTISQPSLNNQITFENVQLNSRSFEPPLYYGIRAGYFFRKMPSIGIETEFIHLKVYSNPQQRVRASGGRRGIPINRELQLGEIVQQYSISHGANLLLFNIVGRQGFGRNTNSGRDAVIFSARTGIGPTIPHTESSVEGNQQEQYELGRLGWQIGGGAEVRLWRGFYGLGEYKYTQTQQRGKIFSGTAESNLKTHHGILGLSYHF